MPSSYGGGSRRALLQAAPPVAGGGGGGSSSGPVVAVAVGVAAGVAVVVGLVLWFIHRRAGRRCLCNRVSARRLCPQMPVCVCARRQQQWGGFGRTIGYVTAVLVSWYLKMHASRSAARASPLHNGCAQSVCWYPDVLYPTPHNSPATPLQDPRRKTLTFDSLDGISAQQQQQGGRGKVRP